MIEVEGLSKSFGQRLALSEVGFTVPKGEIFGLVGPNGSGKTTVLRILATLLRADEGDARIAGASVTHEADRVRALIGYVPESFAVYPRLTAEEHLEFYARIHRLPRAQRRHGRCELLDLVGLAEHRHDDAGRLSRGQRQRLGLARALVHDPGVLLLDDAFGVDPQGQRELRELLRELQRMGKTVVASSHNLPEVQATCTWVGLIESGSMVAAGPLAETGGEAAGAFRRLVGGGAR